MANSDPQTTRRPIWGWTWIAPTGETEQSEIPFALTRADAEDVCRKADREFLGFRHSPLRMGEISDGRS